MENCNKYYHPKFTIVVDLIHILYDLDGCGCGGCCHIVTDDDNIYDDCLDYVIQYCEEEENKDRIDKELSSTICKILKQMTFAQRALLFEYMNMGIDIPIYGESDFDIILDIIGRENIDEVIKKYDYRSRMEE